MEIKYSAFYRTEKGHLRITHGTLTEDDLEDAVVQKEDREDIDHVPVTFESASWDSVDL